jgi:hypothetical protein
MSASACHDAGVSHEPAGLERGLLVGLAVFRWLALAWMGIVILATKDDLAHPLLAGAAVLRAVRWSGGEPTPARCSALIGPKSERVMRQGDRC